MDIGERLSELEEFFLEKRDYEKIKNKVVYYSVDWNLDPDELKEVSPNLKFDSTLSELKKLLENGNKVMIRSHWGRPKDEEDKQIYNTKKFKSYLAEKSDWLEEEEIKYIDHGDLKEALKQDFRVMILPNPRVYPGEMNKDKDNLTLEDVLESDQEREIHEVRPDYAVINDIERWHREDHLYVAAPVLFSKQVRIGIKAKEQLKTIKKAKEDLSYTVVGGSKPGKVKSGLEILEKNGGEKMLTVGIPGGTLYEMEENNNGKLKERHSELYGELKDYLKKGKIEYPEDIIKENGEIKDIGKKTLDCYSEYFEKAREGKSVVVIGPAGDTSKGYVETTRKLVRRILNSGLKAVTCGGNTTAAIDSDLKNHPNLKILTGGGASARLMAGGRNLLDLFYDYKEEILNKESLAEQIKKDKPLYKK